jgi:4'-phosphopantetheinyl transferase
MEPSPSDAIAVWRVSLEIGDTASAALRAHLSGDELRRLQRLHRSSVGRRWLASRAALREILAAELETKPASVRLKLGTAGRPMLDPAVHASELDFNLSHSGELALVATSRGRRVGVDVERERSRDPLRIANRYFSAAEVDAVRSAPEAERRLVFLRYWTAKEALAKGLGRGLSVSSGELELAPGVDGSLVPLREDGEWTLVELSDLPDGYLGTLAVAGGPAAVIVRDWPLGAG